jgi:hypothetical protein
LVLILVKVSQDGNRSCYGFFAVFVSGKESNLVERAVVPKEGAFVVVAEELSLSLRGAFVVVVVAGNFRCRCRYEFLALSLRGAFVVVVVVVAVAVAGKFRCRCRCRCESLAEEHSLSLS